MAVSLQFRGPYLNYLRHVRRRHLAANDEEFGKRLKRERVRPYDLLYRVLFRHVRSISSLLAPSLFDQVWERPNWRSTPIGRELAFSAKADPPCADNASF